MHVHTDQPEITQVKPTSHALWPLGFLRNFLFAIG
jgi:hypothetical protein